MTWYLTLYPPSHRPDPIPARPVLDYLATLPELRRAGPAEFDAADGEPWVHVVVIEARADGGYARATGAPAPERTNLVELVCAYDASMQWYDLLARRIAAHLDWVAVEAGEERQLWPPSRG
ncbi:hypothetical protein SAMN04487939_11459 [Lysobacter sp. yr284]|uniref:hypothetical protein n=1 Tax=Lysobacter TaxID=68 RepID=UPI00089AAE85|nr:hypothetical protein [Lysobacter sp. yr284]SDZ06785.1 hypothetical protein SAMN04487939_11459 [Lysobacter sp. yr284]